MRAIESKDELLRVQKEIDRIVPGKSVFAEQKPIATPPDLEESDEDESSQEEDESIPEQIDQPETVQ
jgi:hypothetical protein